jgi:hypothetical protein
MAVDPTDDPKCAITADAIRSHQKVLQMVLDLEAKLDTHRRSDADGASIELHLDEARAEVAARLTVWREQS